MSTVHLAYGRHGLDVELPDNAHVVMPPQLDALSDEAAALRDAMAQPGSGPPLRELARTARSVAIVFPDLTRPMPNRTVLPVLLRELEAAGVADDAIILVCATGTHRAATNAEMAELVGAEIVERYALHDHQATDPDHVRIGAVDGVDIEVDPRYLAADLRILTGFVEPHFFAGFSGGPKGVVPGLASLSTILEAHSPARIANPRSTWLQREGNPVHDFVRAAVALAPPHFSIDVAINADRKLCAVFAGSYEATHLQACDFVRANAVTSTDGRFDVVVTTNAGYPLDRNLYQAVKGMAAAERVVADGGVVIVAAQCLDGIPGDSRFAELLAAAQDPNEFLAIEAKGELDFWQAQVFARVRARAEIWLVSDGIDADAAASAHCRPLDSVRAGIDEAMAKFGPSARLCVLPEGPLCVATAL